nr:unnamed protein product [Callosobruchus analis]
MVFLTEEILITGPIGILAGAKLQDTNTDLESTHGLEYFVIKSLAHFSTTAL